MKVLAVLACGFIVSLAMVALYKFSGWCGRRAARQERPGEFFARSFDFHLLACVLAWLCLTGSAVALCQLILNSTFGA